MGGRKEEKVEVKKVISTHHFIEREVKRYRVKWVHVGTRV